MGDDYNQAEVDGSQHLFASESRGASAAACPNTQPKRSTAMPIFGEAVKVDDKPGYAGCGVTGMLAWAAGSNPCAEGPTRVPPAGS